MAGDPGLLGVKVADVGACCAVSNRPREADASGPVISFDLFQGAVKWDEKPWAP